MKKRRPPKKLLGRQRPSLCLSIRNTAKKTMIFLEMSSYRL
jgi:hypothetical protein